MSKIKVLDEQLANQIAAGEVVERPASVVKELVENAVDAGSTTIDITIEEGGLSLIRVTDNGGGIEASDIQTAFQRHATSKISTSSDLFRIASLGFRGEALPSIAAVSRLTCVSADSNSGLARKLVIEGGHITADEPANAPQGTDMSVKDLFYNTPARLKYMKSIQTELGHISDYINRLALAHPGIAFTLKHNGSTLLRTMGTGDRLQVIAAIYGTSAAKAMLPVSASDSDYELTGYISKPDLTRANRNGITVVVNGRYIRSHTVNQSLLQAYHTLLPINRFPLVVLELGMHPGLLDVNVHPSKMEVRFSKEAELRALIERAVREALVSQRYIPGASTGGRSERSGPLYVQDSISFHIADRDKKIVENAAQEAAAAKESSAPAAPAYRSEQQFSRDRSSWTGYSPPRMNPPNGGREYVPKGAAEKLYAPAAPSQPIPVDKTEWTIRETADTPVFETETASADPAFNAIGKEPEAASSEQSGARAEELASQEADQPADDSAAKTPRFPELHWIGQHHGTYIVAQADDGLYLIDQHAAHERINYEYYLHKFGNPVSASQGLLVPLTLEFTPGDAAQLRELLGLFKEAGVEMEPFGPQTFLVRAYPEWMPKGEEQALIEEMAELLIQERKSINITKLREKAAIMCACKASIKANDRMTREEGDALLGRLSRCEQPYTCPHGRPIIVHLSTYQLEKMFKRVMS
ncbi:DNA mismatch repair endonuclease MutL [Paenibacillus nanensis]|uniref:DNA mismatch repair protein MutL n=1 Tax=Paenibacillus nanensis TaxID=393251 RepID=A0A3A1UZ87_9BACL|nr:DNA mismatch repair endonuclease MutL [Paenibacillus nanensis]RIX53584.1 DNA mismatch repair endonuclease MutL [Paenibacillus nanensis]